MNNTSSAPFLFGPKVLGESLKEISQDFIRTESQNITSKWYHADNIDLFIWEDENHRIIKQQMSIYGVITEWNLVNGVRTGVMIEEENDEAIGVPGSEIIQFDDNVNTHSLDQALAVLVYVRDAEVPAVELLVDNYKNSPTIDKMDSKELIGRYSYLKNKKEMGFFHKLFRWFLGI